MSFGEVDFDTSGLILRFGTSAAGEVGGDVALGVFGGGNAYNVQDLAEPQAAQLQPRGARWIPVIAGRCHFRTEEARLDGEDEASIDRVVEAIVRHERFYPGDIFFAVGWILTDLNELEENLWKTGKRNCGVNSFDYFGWLFQNKFDF